MVPGDSFDLPEGLVTVDDAARYLGVARETIRRHISQGRLEAHRQENTPGRHGWCWMIDTAELMRVRAEKESDTAS